MPGTAWGHCDPYTKSILPDFSQPHGSHYLEFKIHRWAPSAATMRNHSWRDNIDICFECQCRDYQLYIHTCPTPSRPIIEEIYSPGGVDGPPPQRRLLCPQKWPPMTTGVDNGPRRTWRDLGKRKHIHPSKGQGLTQHTMPIERICRQPSMEEGTRKGGKWQF